MEQLDALNRLLAELRQGNAFYRARLAAAGVDWDLASLDEYFARVPFTYKHELTADQEAHPPYGTNLTYPLERYTRYFQTSGTTAQPLRWLDTPESWSWMLDSWARVFAAAGVTATDRILFAFSFGPFLGFWTAFESAQRIGCLLLPGGGLRTSARLQMLAGNAATVLCCTPTYAIHLGEAAEIEGADVSSIRHVIVAGEPGGSIPAVRARMEQLYPNARVHDHHGMTEIGPASYGCPNHPFRLHIIESAYVAEVIDPATGAPIGPGHSGELVLTPLGRTGSPILRYRTGDIVQPAPRGTCECGSDDLALDGGILGRTDDMVVVRGVNVFPGTVEALLRDAGGIAEFQVEVDRRGALPELTIQVEPQDGTEADTACAAAAEALHSGLGLRAQVTAAEPGSLPRFEMKARRWRLVR